MSKTKGGDILSVIPGLLLFLICAPTLGRQPGNRIVIEKQVYRKIKKLFCESYLTHFSCIYAIFLPNRLKKWFLSYFHHFSTGIANINPFRIPGFHFQCFIFSLGAHPNIRDQKNMRSVVVRRLFRSAYVQNQKHFYFAIKS